MVDWLLPNASGDGRRPWWVSRNSVPMGNYVIGCRKSVIASPSELGNYKTADIPHLTADLTDGGTHVSFS